MSNTEQTQEVDLVEKSRLVEETIKNHLLEKVDPQILSDRQRLVLKEIIWKHSNKSQKTQLTDLDKKVLQWILQSASDNLDLLKPISPNTPNYIFPMTEFENMKEIIEITHNRTIRDIDSTPQVLIDEGISPITVTLKLRTAFAIILTDAFNKPVDRLGKEPKRMMSEVSKLAREMTDSIRLTLIEKKIATSFDDAKTFYWLKVPLEIQRKFCILLENRVLYLHRIPISRCKGMWIANHYLYKAMKKSV